MAQAAELVRVQDIADPTIPMPKPELWARTKVAFAEARKRSRQRRQLDGYLAVRDVGRQTGTWG